jgi:hypothetical protein
MPYKVVRDVEFEKQYLVAFEDNRDPSGVLTGTVCMQYTTEPDVVKPHIFTDETEARHIAELITPYGAGKVISC